MTPKIVGLIPARSSSKRVKSKNIRLLDGHPLIAYTIAVAKQSRLFDSVVVSTDSPEIAEIAKHYGAEVPFLRPAQYAGDFSPDMEWVEYTLRKLVNESAVYDCFAILRPTSPFRTVETLKRAWEQFLLCKDADSLRAVELCKQHPAKMWVVENKLMKPLLKDDAALPPMHSRPYQSLPKIYVQNASLEIAWSKTVFEHHSISGKNLTPFITNEYEGFDINYPEDWVRAEQLIDQKVVQLPMIEMSLYQEGALNA